MTANPPGYNRSGLTSGAQRGNCKIFIQGPSICKRSGNQMWYDYQNIRAHNCARCGTKKWEPNDLCMTTVNYVA